MNDRIQKALTGKLSPSELNDDEQEEYFERFSELMWTPSAEELAFFADLERRGLGVGMDDEGNFVFPAVRMPRAPTTIQ